MNEAQFISKINAWIDKLLDEQTADNFNAYLIDMKLAANASPILASMCLVGEMLECIRAYQDSKILAAYRCTRTGDLLVATRHGFTTNINAHASNKEYANRLNAEAPQHVTPHFLKEIESVCKSWERL